MGRSTLIDSAEFAVNEALRRLNDISYFCTIGKDEVREVKHLTFCWKIVLFSRSIGKYIHVLLEKYNGKINSIEVRQEYPDGG